jgi:hypothetical protein
VNPGEESEVRAKHQYTTATVSILALSAFASQAYAAATNLDVMIGGSTATTTDQIGWSPDTTNQYVHLLNNSVTWSTTNALQQTSSFTVNRVDPVTGAITQWDADPVLLFSASATNDTDTVQTYSFTFTLPAMNPTLLGTINSHAELGVTLTDGGDNVVSLSPTGLYLLTSFDRYADNTSISKNVDIGTNLNTQGLTSFAKDSSLLCAQACVSMYATLSFTLSAHDSVGFSGKIVQTAVPLPAAGLLFGSGLLGLVGFGRRRKLAA